jgi:hypothetical protein
MQFGEGGHMFFESMTTTQDMDVIEETDEDEEVHWCEPEQRMMLNDGIGNSIYCMENCKELQESVFADGQALKDDVMVALSQVDRDNKTLAKNPRKSMMRMATTEFYNVQSDNWCVNAGYEDWKSSKDRVKKELPCQRHIHNYVMQATLFHENNEKDVQGMDIVEDISEAVEWLKDISVEEMLHWATEEYREAMMTLTDKDVANMVSEGMKHLSLIGCFSQIKEKNLQERFHRLKVELGDVKYCICEYSQNLESSQRYASEGVIQPKDSNNSRQKQ